MNRFPHQIPAATAAVAREMRSNGSRFAASLLTVMIGTGASGRPRADLEEFAGLLLDALGRVQYHQRAVDRGQRAMSDLAEILVARMSRRLKGSPLILQAHHG